MSGTCRWGVEGTEGAWGERRGRRGGGVICLLLCAVTLGCPRTARVCLLLALPVFRV